MKDKALFISTKNLDYIRNVQEIKRLEESYTSCKIIGSYSKSYFVRLCKVYTEILFTKMSEFDIIWVGFAPQLVLPLFWKFRGKKVVIDFFISLYDTICFDRKLISPKGIFGRMLYKLDRLTLEGADEIICDTKAHKNYFLEEFKVKNKEYNVLYLEADTSLFYPRKEKRPLSLEEKFIVLYFGTILPLQGVEVILSAVDLLKEEKELHVFIIGPMKEELKKGAPKAENITYIDWLSGKDLARYIAMADLCLAGHFHGEISKAGRTIPGKAYIFKAMEKKIILGDNQANHEIFKKDDNTFFVPMGNPARLAEMILLIKNIKRNGEE